jgi:Domain of unknown function (DUF222)/HNH endonuclease
LIDVLRYFLVVLRVLGGEHVYDGAVLPSALDALDAAVGRLDLAVDDRDLAAVLALRDRLDARISGAVRAVDAAGLWDAVGATSMTAWTADQGRMARPRAAVMTRVARLTARLPVTAGAWADGRLSTGQVETICSFLTDTTVDVFARHESEIVPVLEPLSLAEVAAAMRAWRAHLDGPDPAPTAPSSLHASRTFAGRARVDGDLDPDTGELLLTALRVALQAAPDTDGEPPRVPAQRRADALGDICRFFLDHQTAALEGHRHRPHVNLVFDMVPAADGTGYAIADARTVDGYPIDGVTAGRYLCDSLLYRVLVHAKSAILDHGRATRAVPPPLWNVLLLRDQHCRWKGCDRPGAWCEAHHVIWWENGGTTDIANLVLLCSRHHHIAHRPGWTADLTPDGTLTVTDPWGITRTTRPPATGPPLPFAA